MGLTSRSGEIDTLSFLIRFFFIGDGRIASNMAVYHSTNFATRLYWSAVTFQFRIPFLTKPRISVRVEPGT